MTALLIFSITLIVAMLLSELAGRSFLSMAVLFLLAGFISGTGMLDRIQLQATDPVVQKLAEFALFAVLFTDGTHVRLPDLRSKWHLPSRALIIGLPLTMLGTALLAHIIIGLPWLDALLVGAILSPTDPVFAAAIINRKEVPERLRHMLNVESGLNDGLALPIVLALLAILGREKLHLAHLGWELAMGIALGIVVPLAACGIERTRYFGVEKKFEPIFAFSIGLLVLALGFVSHVNLYLAAFAAGITLAAIRPDLRKEFRQFGDIVAELLKLAALLIFGVLISPSFIAAVPASGYVFAALALIAVRPAAILISFLGTPLGWREKITAGWFGPKGFASVVYGLLMVQSGVPGAEKMFYLIAVVVIGSMVAHSSTDVLFARWFRRSGSSSPPHPC